ncbi:MAG: hypothetical protein EPN47_16765 [Acidobacteria bacterium]|nr:MAG: hypothetical protein EPN47_16765 [Acidobacteriota bacterium]
MRGCHFTVKNNVAMLTDHKPRKRALLADFIRSDENRILDLPPDDRLKALCVSLEAALKAGAVSPVRLLCENFLTTAADFYKVERTPIRVLAARPVRSREGGWGYELFGDYHPETALIRVWMRTAVLKKVTSYGTFLSTLCHEFCHHLDYKLLGYGDTWHTRGFYERAAALYHHARGTPEKKLFWVGIPGGRWRIDWQRTNRDR